MSGEIHRLKQSILSKVYDRDLKEDVLKTFCKYIRIYKLII